MVKAEKVFKWGIVIVVIFGILNAFYFLNLVIGLKIALPLLCVFLIGSILLQSGKGGGLAAIGGLGDQSAFGTRTSTFLSKVTYLIGAAFIVATIFLFKLSIPTKTIGTDVIQEMPAEHSEHEHLAHEGEHKHGDVPHTEGQASDVSDIGMQNIVEERAGEPAQESPHRETVTKDVASQGQSAGMAPVEEGKQASGVAEKSTSETQK